MIKPTHKLETYWIIENKTCPTPGFVPATVWTHDIQHVPESFIRICPVCGEVWSKVIVNHPDTKYIPESRKCPQHGAGLVGVFKDGYEMPREAMIHDLKHSKPEKSYIISLITGGN